MGFIDTLTGRDQADASRDAGTVLDVANKQNIKRFRGAFRGNARLLTPLIGEERRAQRALNRLIQNPNSVRDSDAFQDQLSSAVDTVNNNFTARGKAFSGQRALALRDTDLGLSRNFFNDRFRQLFALSRPNAQNALINLNNLRAAQESDSLINARTAFASGVLGAANAKAAGLNNLINLGTSALSAAGGFPSLPRGSSPTGGVGALHNNPINGIRNFDVPPLPFG